jgi:hypothetical protein
MYSVKVNGKKVSAHPDVSSAVGGFCDALNTGRPSPAQVEPNVMAVVSSQLEGEGKFIWGNVRVVRDL